MMKMVDDLKAFLESVEQVDLKLLETKKEPSAVTEEGTIEQDQQPVDNPFSTMTDLQPMQVNVSE